MVRLVVVAVIYASSPLIVRVGNFLGCFVGNFMDGFWLFIGLYNIFSRLPLGNAQIHSLLLDIPVRLRLRHVQTFNEEPFRPIHQTDLTDLFLLSSRRPR